MDEIDRDIDTLLEGFIKDKINNFKKKIDNYIADVKKRIAERKAIIAAENHKRIANNYRNEILRLPIDISGDMKYLMKDAVDQSISYMNTEGDGINNLEDDSWIREHLVLMYAALKCKDILKPDEIEAVEKAEKMYNQLLPRVESNMRRAASIHKNNPTVRSLYLDFKRLKDNVKKSYRIDDEIEMIEEYLGDRDKEVE